MIIELPTDGHIESVYFIGDKQETKIECHDTSYIMLSCTIRTYPYKGKNEPKIYERSYKIIPFKGIATVYLGDIFEDYFMIPNKLWEIFDFAALKDGENIIPLYKPLEVDIIFKEYDLNTENLLEEKTIHNLRFIRGKYSDIDLFKNKLSVQRSTVNSIFSYTLYETSSNSDFYLYKNKKMTSGIKSYPTILTSYLWKDPKLKTGDTFVLRNNAKAQEIIINHIVKKGLQTYYIIWLDENLNLKIKDFTGRFITKITHSLTQSTTIENGNSSSRTIEDIRGLNMILNTGFIFKEDILLLQSIIGSAKSWISMDNLKTFISFVSTTKEIEYDSEAQLYDFDMEITLNKEIEDHSTEIKMCPLLTGINYKNTKISDTHQSFTFSWDKINVSTVWSIYIYIKYPGSTDWKKEIIPIQPSFFTISLKLGIYSFRFELIGKCENTEPIESLPGFDDVGIGNTCPLLTGLNYSYNNSEGKQSFNFTWDPVTNSQVNSINFYVKEPGEGWKLNKTFPRSQSSFFYGNLPLGKYSFRFELVGQCENTIPIDSLPGFDEIGEIKGGEDQCPLITNLQYSISANTETTQYFKFTWDKISDVNAKKINIYIKKQSETSWDLPIEIFSHNSEIKVGGMPLEKHSFRFEITGNCTNNVSINSLPGFDNIGYEAPNYTTKSIIKDNYMKLTIKIPDSLKGKIMRLEYEITKFKYSIGGGSQDYLMEQNYYINDILYKQYLFGKGDYESNVTIIEENKNPNDILPGSKFDFEWKVIEIYNNYNYPISGTITLAIVTTDIPSLIKYTSVDFTININAPYV